MTKAVWYQTQYSKPPKRQYRDAQDAASQPSIKVLAKFNPDDEEVYSVVYHHALDRWVIPGHHGDFVPQVWTYIPEMVFAESPVADDISPEKLIMNERIRQITEEGYGSEWDDQYTDGQLGAAAGCYAMPERVRSQYQSYHVSGRFFPRWWPWSVDHWKPGKSDEGRLRDLAKAGALIIAEMDRLIRKASKNK